jgi:hypothetical protein
MTNLKALTEDHLSKSNTSDPRDAIAGIVAAVPARDLRDVLAQALSGYVRVVSGNLRRRAYNHARPEPEYDKGGKPAPSPTTATPSRRWADAATVVEDILNAREAVDGEWFTLGELTRPRVEWLAGHRRLLSASNSASAERYERLAKEMDNHHAETVADLPPDTITEVFG